jgi:CO dehydrogenase/acetyl-CoA synthase beta subunit
MNETGREVSVLTVPTTSDLLREELNGWLEPGDTPSIILRSDAFVDLGSPEMGSCSFVLWANDTSMVRDGRITVIGPDIQESSGKSLPFGQVLIVAGKKLASEDQQALNELQHLNDRIGGYMVRNMCQNMWCRVSNDAGARGFSFRTIGSAFMYFSKEDHPCIEAVETVFVTSNKKDLKALQGIGVQVDKIVREVIENKWKIQGYEIDCAALNCECCSDKRICDDIKEVLRLRKKKAANEEDNRLKETFTP